MPMAKQMLAVCTSALTPTKNAGSSSLHGLLLLRRPPAVSCPNNPSANAVCATDRNDRDIQQRQHRRQQKFLCGQIKISLVGEQIHDNELAGARRSVQKAERPAPPALPDQYQKVTGHIAGEIFANQTKGKAHKMVVMINSTRCAIS